MRQKGLENAAAELEAKAAEPPIGAKLIAKAEQKLQQAVKRMETQPAGPERTAAEAALAAAAEAGDVAALDAALANAARRAA